MTFKEAIDVSTEQCADSGKPMAVLVAEMTDAPLEDVARFVSITLDYLREGGAVDVPETDNPNEWPPAVRDRLAHVVSAITGALQLGFNLGQASAAEAMADLDSELDALPDAGADPA